MNGSNRKRLSPGALFSARIDCRGQAAILRRGPIIRSVSRLRTYRGHVIDSKSETVLSPIFVTAAHGQIR